MTGIDLRVARIRAGLTINEMAARLGVSRNTVRAWEQAKAAPPERAVRYLDAIERKAAA